MFVKHLQEYLDKFTEGRNGMRQAMRSVMREFIL